MKVTESEGETEGVSVRDCIQLISTLLTQIPSMESFKGKWSLIAATLTNLQTHLSDSDFPASNPLSIDLLRSLSQTLQHALSLAQHCHSPNPPNGKLKTQSDLHSLLDNLNRHLHDSTILSRTHTDNAAALFTNPRDSLRSQSRDLITRLQIGTPDSRNSAMDSLLSLLHQDDKNVVIAVAQGVVPVLVRTLDHSTSSEPKEKAVAAIARISTVDTSKPVLAAEGLLLLNHLLRVLDSGSGFAKEKACIALQALSYSKENARAIGSRGGISSLLEICQAGTPGSQASAAGVLRNLSRFAEIKENLVEENAVFVLLGLASSGTALAQENAIACLCGLISDDQSLKLSVVREGGLETLKNFWESGRSPEVVIDFLGHLASCSRVADVVVSDGFVVPHLVGALGSGVMAVRVAAGRAVYGMCLESAKARKELGECGGVSPLIKMLVDGKSAEEKEAGAKALSVMLMHAGNRRVFRKDERGIVSAVQLLNPSVVGLDKRYPVALLELLVHSKKCKKQMVAAGACVYTQKLVEMEVHGAKKLLESLGRAKIWGVFARP
ncbi:hypothetical protein PIB30_073032 [Stylosanthes scabra]|uniref:DUF7032 domain-containing protein n=1 Tax=Stylosanthes scabra TaxID=79078 RepID=A0ABU6QNU1_9FABA|nr:hypothetical protein [Stylosanthes scabra]